MAPHAIPLLAFVGLFATVVYKYLIHPVFLSPLAKAPAAHWSAPISPLWVLNKRRAEQETVAIHDAHQRLGPIIRLAPNEISVNSVDGGLRSIYAGGYEKGDYYLNIFKNYGVMPMFTMRDHESHSKRKRMLSNIYAKSTLQSSPSVRAISEILMEDRFVARLREYCRLKQPVEMYTIFAAVTHDFVSAYIFGLRNGSHFVQEPDMCSKFFLNYKARQRYQFWPQEMAGFTRLLGKVGLRWMVVPKWVNTANNNIEAMILEMCDKAEKQVRKSEVEGEKGNVEDWPSVYIHLRNVLLKENSKADHEKSTEQLVQKQRLTVASELLDHTLAGFDTSSIVLTFLAWRLSQPAHKIWQAKIRDEILGLSQKWDAKEVDGLPILQAVLMETLRLHAAIPGNQPRITPAKASLGTPGHTVSDLPAGVRVQAQAWSLHRNADVFPDPEAWLPERWLDSTADQLKEMGRWFWAFGSGGRMCVGSNLAMLDMKAIIVAIWGSFETTVVDDAGMVHNGGYVAEPVGKDGKYCVLDLREL